MIKIENYEKIKEKCLIQHRSFASQTLARARQKSAL